ncbi:phosphatidylinositol 4-phosphate 3-kinase C2 domain-containing subunit beta isoform X2 [Episyrphus balteatus]|nr:phosphatidylinositol 4-phosphate 3-kinase C2 domain-containing subunit beta isoform X2 [Episyrphus balteatus]XP_055854097.1 phosphatidylinositol 4-phosphate 3-kinase C2 domain-containing subunit beta isoform X2 [Episyrphus balteatus]
MANQAEIDYEKQFQEDLAKATALSIESQALDDFRRSKSQYGYMSNNRASPPTTGYHKKQNAEKEYSSNVQSRLRPGSFGGPNSSSIAPPPAVPSRRHSEIRLPEETPPTAVAESDLISFASPTSLKKPENTTFDKLLEDIQKLSTAPPPQSLPSINSHPNFGSTPAFLNQQLNQTGMQLVPFTPQQPAQKTPLTNEELSKLYSMPTQQVRHPHAMGYMRPAGQYTPVYQRPAITAAGYGYGVAPATYGYQYGMQRPGNITTQQSYPPVQFPSNSQHQQASTTSEIPIQNVSNPSSAMVLQNPTNPMLQMTKSQSLSGVSSLGTSPSMRSNSSNGINRKVKRNLGDDLIDLTQEDPSRVSVLEAFDPLLNEDDYGSDNASDCTSYYAEYDPFDYLYSGGTQYSDPVYEAVNKLDRTPVSPNVSLSIGWRSELYTKDAFPSTSSGLVSPPPPLPPRNNNKNSESLDHSMDNVVLDRRKNFTKLYEMVTDSKAHDPELLEFYYMVKDLRSKYRYDDVATNVGHIVASEFNFFYPLEQSIKILVYPALNGLQKDCEASKKGPIEGYGSPIVFTSDINSPVELVIGHAFCALEGQILGTVDDYAAKPIGVSEWLSPTSKLSQLQCVHDSLKLEKDVYFGLCMKTEATMSVIARTQRDDLRDETLRPEEILPNETATTISYDNMMILIETLETEIDKFEMNAADSSSRSILSCSGVVQGVKAICALLGSIDTLEIASNINDLKKICEDGQVTYSSTYGVNPEVGSDHGDYAEVIMRPKSTMEQIKSKLNQIRDAVQDLIENYSNAFRVDFCVKSVDYTTTPIPISCVLKPVIVSVSCLHRPPPNWKFEDYSMGVQINYGTRFISKTLVIKCSNDTSGGLFPRLKFESWITFDSIPICTLPRESRLIFVLFGTQTAENDQSNDQNGEKKQITTELGWCALQLFDYKREMVCGSYLLSIWPPTTDKFLGPAPARGCHPQPDLCPVLSIEVPPYGGRIVFPEPLENPPPAPKYDFNSLDCNLQQELLDTAEQGYADALEQREVFWEKRHYLQKFPYALPKVLHAAHSWDYASLIDLHSLLRSWSQLSPLQALELLLPRYPDAQVRAKAVEWISRLPNDQLVDSLPQLLQALKHDTYEASAMARFLLSKCLESPRIAHHMYWLLVHSLPGDAPQNTIDASSSEYDESLITQARYHRRNKMMLRALLAICGEKLLSRFLSQNMMCKNLADIAYSVKVSKESLRQKALCQGMDSVHQALIDKPTSLPLGPGLEVTGVNVRGCSYFNSNTLPLKISYYGPDRQLLPAIFKSGDDLQQDMLTIQLVRVMNKLWLADGLDLKMVTFDCVPTGYKKGMIELVSDAETLRKIQVEYGLTGSFKDRPIAEWLAKQNPSQLEYARAVKNFTVSCAGYSVATYVLGICDRHNDNIMLKTSGHLFHIDFGKFLGDAQMFGNFKRDRTPFVLTSDMAYVINGGDKPSTDFHYFVDLCCHAFNIIRKHGDLILHMLALMATAGIPGVTADAVSYVKRALLPSQSNPEAAASFAKMIQFSLKSWFTQFNFFLHNLSQLRFSNDEGSGELLSFVPRKYGMQQDGRLKSVMVVRCQKHYDMEKYYTYILRVTRHNQPDPTHLFRSYKEFSEFHQKLCLHFPLAKLHSLPSGIHVGRSNVKSVAERRLPEIQRFLVSLFNSADEIAHSDLVYTFFHPLLRDQQEANIEVSKVKEIKPIIQRHSNSDGAIKISLQYRRGALTVMIHHAKGLPTLQGGTEPNTYVKCYLKPDQTKVTKRKTKVIRKTCVPSFMETLEYRMPIEHIQNRFLNVTVWSHDTLQENELLGGVQIDLSKYDLRLELIDWFALGHVPRS